MKIYFYAFCLFFSSITFATVVNGRFLITNLNETNYSVKIQLNTDTGTDDLGSATLTFNYNEFGISFPEFPIAGIHYTFHNFSDGIFYQQATVTHNTFLDLITINIELNVDNFGTLVAMEPAWTDVVTINFSVINPLETASLNWTFLDIFDGNNSTLWTIGSFPNENTPLPVELISFTGKSTKEGNILSWETSNEVNNLGFTIQKGKFNKHEELFGEWDDIGFIEGFGNSNIHHTYTYSDRNITDDNNCYRLKQIDNDGKVKLSEIIYIVNDFYPTDYSLEQNYPNPFNPSTRIDFSLPFEGEVTLLVYNAIGETVAELLNSKMEAGAHSIEFDGNNLPSGMYIYQIKSNEFISTKKMLLIK